MGVSIGYWIKAIAVILAIGLVSLSIFASTQSVKVEARANLTAYLSVPPTSWEPFGRFVPATTGWYITHTLGWYNVTLMGNLGLGDGSVHTLNNSSNQNVNYTGNNFMAADISTVPWNPSRLTSAPPLYPEPAAAANVTNQTTAEAGNATNATTTTVPGINLTTTNATSAGIAGNNSSEMPGIGNTSLKMPEKINLGLSSWLSAGSGGTGNFGDLGSAEGGGNASAGGRGNASTGGAGNVSEDVTATPANATTPIFSNLGPNVPLNDVYHPMLLGRPVDDLYYEYPLANSVTMYARLMGLPMGGGPPVNMGIACLGYGY